MIDWHRRRESERKKVNDGPHHTKDLEKSVKLSERSRLRFYMRLWKSIFRSRNFNDGKWRFTSRRQVWFISEPFARSSSLCVVFLHERTQRFFFFFRGDLLFRTKKSQEFLKPFFENDEELKCVSRAVIFQSSLPGCVLPLRNLLACCLDGVYEWMKWLIFICRLEYVYVRVESALHGKPIKLSFSFG